VLPLVRARDRGLALELAYGCLRLERRLDTWIESFTDRPLARIDGAVLDWLRLGLYQLKELRVPDHAAVAETVRHARRSMDAGRAGFVNAVLRAATTDPDSDPFPSRDTDPLGYLTTWGSHPEWLVSRWLARWGLHDTLRLVKAGNTAPPVILRSLDGAPGPVPEGIELTPVPGWPGSFELARGSPSEALATVGGVIQDPAAAAVVDYVGDEIAGPVYDACAAPGTKTMGVATRARGAVIAADISRARLGRVPMSAGRLGLAVAVAVMDARRPALSSARTVIADVPCTGTGVLRRRPDARWRIDESGLAGLVELQSQILDGVAGIVEKGGVLVYSTCSLEPEENEMQIEAFLDRHPEFARDPNTGCPVPHGCLDDAGDLFVRPWLTGTDGSYAARLRRV
jgi:16S rRNA (cytosine967-C5)-methyltransferase